MLFEIYMLSLILVWLLRCLYIFKMMVLVLFLDNWLFLFCLMVFSMILFVFLSVKGDDLVNGEMFVKKFFGV